MSSDNHENIQAAARQRKRPNCVSTHPTDALLYMVNTLATETQKSKAWLYDEAMREYMQRRSKIEED